MKNLKMKLLATAIAIFGWFSVAIAQDKPAQTLINNVNIFDGENEKLIENANVLIEGNLIKTISTSPIKAKGATVIDGGGRTLMPGLTDAHWHSMAAYMTLDPFSAGAGKLNLVAAAWDGKDAYAGLHHSERPGRTCI